MVMSHDINHIHSKNNAVSYHENRISHYSLVRLSFVTDYIHNIYDNCHILTEDSCLYNQYHNSNILAWIYRTGLMGPTCGK